VKNRDQTSPTHGFADAKSSYAFDNGLSCLKREKSFLRKDLAASIEVIS
jgi:hypothetical protein